MSEKSIEEIENDNSEALEKAMEELDDLAKSHEEPKDELDELTKALEEELGDDLSKSGKEDEEDNDENEDDEDGKPEGFGKSQDDSYDEELVKASEAFASLEKSVSEMGFGVAVEMSDLRKSMAALLNLNIKQAKVIASLAKSRQEDVGRIEKSMTDFGAKAIAPNQARFGVGSIDETAELTKSISEVSDLLTKAVQAGQIDARHLSIFGTYKDVARLPEDVKKIIGL